MSAPPRSRRAVAGVLLAMAGALLAALLVDGVLERRAARTFMDTGAVRAPLVLEELGRLPAELRESSGLAVSRRHTGVLWTHNDSGDEPVLRAIDTTAAVVARARLTQARNVDWEDVALGPCPYEAPTDCLYVSDTGNNQRNRRRVTIYVVPEPAQLPADGAIELGGGQVVLSYPVEAHDAEGLAVAPDGALVLVTKGRWPPIRAFTIRPEQVAAALTSGEPIALGPGTVLPIDGDWTYRRQVTGADVGMDGTVLAARTYTEIYFFRMPLTDPPVQVGEPCFLGRTEPSGEAVAFLEDGRLLLTSESGGGLVGALLRVRCRAVSPEEAPGG